MTKKYTAPWVIKSYQGNYYVSNRLLFDDPKGTACVSVDLSKKVAQIHPDDMKHINEWYEIPTEDYHSQVSLEISKSFPSLQSRELELTLDTIDFVSKYNPDLGDYISKVNFE